MGVKIISGNGIMTAMLEGDLDHHSAKYIRESIDYEANKKKPKILKLDFGSIQFMDSSGIGLVMGRYKLMNLIGGKLRVINVPKHINRIMKLSGLEVLGVIENGSEKYENSKWNESKYIK